MPEKLRTYWKIQIRVDRLHRHLEAPYTAPFEVLQCTSEYYLIKFNEDTHSKLSVDSLKPYVEVSNNHSKQTNDATTKEKLIHLTETPEKKTNPSHPKVTKTAPSRLVSWKKDNRYIYY